MTAPVLFQRSRGERCLSDLCLDELVAGALTAQDAAAAQAHLAGCALCEARRAALAADRALFRQAMPPLVVPAPLATTTTAAVTATAARPRSRAARLLPLVGSGAGALALAAGLLLWLARPDDGGVLTKGSGVALEVVVVTDAGARALLGGDVVHPGDALEFQVRARDAHVAAVVAVDGAGGASVYAPFAPLQPGSVTTLPQGALLDDVTGAERLYAYACDQAVDLAPVLAVLPTSLAAPPVPRGCAVDVVVLDKRPAP